jgi:hypothetical protein
MHKLVLKFLTALVIVAGLLGGETMATAAYAQAQNAGLSAEKKEISDYKLTTDKLSKLEAAVKALNKLYTQSPGLEATLTKETGDHNTIADSNRVIEKHPEVAGAIKGAGFSTTREYVVMLYALLNTFSNVKMKKMGYIKQIPASISAENAAFVEQNYDRVNSIMDTLTPKDEDDK